MGLFLGLGLLSVSLLWNANEDGKKIRAAEAEKAKRAEVAEKHRLYTEKIKEDDWSWFFKYPMFEGKKGDVGFLSREGLTAPQMAVKYNTKLFNAQYWMMRDFCEDYDIYWYQYAPVVAGIFALTSKRPYFHDCFPRV